MTIRKTRWMPCSVNGAYLRGAGSSPVTATICKRVIISSNRFLIIYFPCLACDRWGKVLEGNYSLYFFIIITGKPYIPYA